MKQSLKQNHRSQVMFSSFILFFCTFALILLSSVFAAAEPLPNTAKLLPPETVLMIDIDNFKHYNDTYGHIQGDEALREVTRVVSKNTRGQDFVARYGGEEFIVILPGASIKEAETIAERMRKQVAETKIKPTRKGLPQGYDKTTISMGISELGKEGVQGMLEGADQALYQAKREGKNRIKILKK